VVYIGRKPERLKDCLSLW
jgi:putative resolvase